MAYMLLPIITINGGHLNKQQNNVQERIWIKFRIHPKSNPPKNWIDLLSLGTKTIGFSNNSLCTHLIVTP